MANRVHQPAHGGNVWAAAQRLDMEPGQILDFSANINPLGPPPAALQAIQESLQFIHCYPEPEAEELKSALAKYLGEQEENLILGNGGSELIYHLLRELYQGRIVLPAPTFAEYGRSVRKPRYHRFFLKSQEEFRLDVEKLVKVIQQKDVVVLCNPNNPTGKIISQEEVLYLVGEAEKIGAKVIVDEAFMDFVLQKESVVPFVEDHPDLFVIGSLTKFFALPGLRLGYLAASRKATLKLAETLPPWRINTPAQFAGKAALQDSEYIEKTLNYIDCEREHFYGELQKLEGLKPLTSAVNFILIENYNFKHKTKDLKQLLEARGILIRTSAGFHGLSAAYFRLAVRTTEENKRLLGVLQEINT